MPHSLDSFFADKVEHKRREITRINKVLCILEGGDELSFVKKVYEIYNDDIECQDFVNDKIKLSYGMNLIEWQGNTSKLKDKSKEKCNFQGGDLYSGDDRVKAPLPILESLINEDIELYKAIIVMFDKDRDMNNEVEDKAREKLETITNNILFLSTPCFEKESMTFFMNKKIKEYIIDNYSVIDDSSCLWYKQNYNKCLAFNRVKNAQKLSTMIDKLDKNHLENSSIDEDISKLIHFIKINT